MGEVGGGAPSVTRVHIKRTREYCAGNLSAYLYPVGHYVWVAPRHTNLPICLFQEEERGGDSGPAVAGLHN